tara:strand:- start:5455 stop:6162 length:708 start_codon:yes stop_codon:yes gene_type:complete
MTDLFFRGHLGLGDHIVCNGLFRVLHEKHDKSIIPVKRHNRYSVERMFQDLSNVVVVPVINDFEADVYAKNYTSFGHNVVALGHYGKEFMKDAATFDESFYNQAGVEYQARWDSFYYPPDETREQQAYSEFCKRIDGDKYVFVHDDEVRGLKINENNLPDLPVFRPDHKFGAAGKISFFDYGLLLRNATEIHCIDSSFALFADHIDTSRVEKKVIHRYLRRENLNPRYKDDWEIV